MAPRGLSYRRPVSEPTASSDVRRLALVWSWQHALAGVVFGLPAAVVTVVNPELGIALAVGVLPAAMIGIPARRRNRVVILLIGTLAGVSLFAGGVLAHLPLVLAAALLAATVIGASLLTTRAPQGRLVLTLCAPLVAAGLSYDDYASSAATLALLVAGSAYAWLVSLLWPARATPDQPPPPLPPVRAMLDYGVRMGLAAALVFVLVGSTGVDHPGWAPAACLLVARPQVDLLQRRGVGRVVSVVLGATAAALLVHLELANVVLAIIAAAVLGLAAGTAGSRWYITSAFTTLLVFVLMLDGHPAQTVGAFDARVGETVLGVGAAYLFGWAIPQLRHPIRGSRSGNDRL